MSLRYHAPPVPGAKISAHPGGSVSSTELHAAWVMVDYTNIVTRRIVWPDQGMLFKVTIVGGDLVEPRVVNFDIPFSHSPYNDDEFLPDADQPGDNSP